MIAENKYPILEFDDNKEAKLNPPALLTSPSRQIS